MSQNLIDMQLPAEALAASRTGQAVLRPPGARAGRTA